MKALFRLSPLGVPLSAVPKRNVGQGGWPLHRGVPLSGGSEVERGPGRLTATVDNPTQCLSTLDGWVRAMVRSVIQGTRPLAERIDPARTALVVVDVQNDFCHPEGVQGRFGVDLSDMPAMAENVALLVEAARDCGAFIVWVRATYDPIVQGPPFAERLNRRPESLRNLCLEGSSGAEWYGRVRPRAAGNEVVVTKHRNSAFWGTPIDLYLRSNGINAVILTGAVTSGCVESNARDAYFRDYFIILASDACASHSRARHDAALAKLGHSYGEVVATAAILESWSSAPAGPRGWEAATKAACVPSDDSSLLDPSAAALIIVDLQDDIVPAPAPALLSRIAALAEAARIAGVLVIHLHSRMNSQSSSPAWQFRTAHLGLPRGAADPVPMVELVPTRDVVVIDKHRESGFVDTRLETVLRANDIRCVALVGTDIVGGIDATARDAAMRDFHAVVVPDAVTGDPRHHDAAVAILGSRFAVMVSSQAIVSIWDKRSVSYPQAGAF